MNLPCLQGLAPVPGAIFLQAESFCGTEQRRDAQATEDQAPQLQGQPVPRGAGRLFDAGQGHRHLDRAQQLVAQ